MFFGYLILTISVIISVIAAYYSVVGLTAIFAAAVVPVMIMGGALEAGKIVATVWLHNNWKRAGYAFKLYLVPAIVFLMLLTSMGIFGFLSKAHGDQSLVSGDAMSKVAIYDEKIKISKDNIDANRKALKQMDEAVDQVMGRSSDEKGADKAVAVRRSQQKERTRLQSEIQAEQKTITALSEEAAPLRAEFRKVEAEVGPIKYIAALIYGDNPDQNLLERAVRWVIILIVVVFDPLALCLILAANKQLEWAMRGKGGWVHDDEEKPIEQKPVEETPVVDTTVAVEDAEPIAEKVVTESTPTEAAQPEQQGFSLFVAEKPVHEEPPAEPEKTEEEMEADVKQFFENGKLVAHALDVAEAEADAEEANLLIAEMPEPEPELDIIAADAEHIAALEAQQQETLAALDVMIENYDELAEQKEQLQQSLDSATSQLVSTEGQRTKLSLDLAAAHNELEEAKKNGEVLDEQLTALVRYVAELEAQIDALQQPAPAAEPEVTEVKAEVIAEEQSVEQAPVEATAEEQPEEPKILTLGVDPVERPGDYVTRQSVTGMIPGMGVEWNSAQAKAGGLAHRTPYQADEIAASGTAGFGLKFPEEANKGDMFLRVDMVPNRAFKYNGQKWIAIDKDKTDVFAYDQQYIQHLSDRLESGEYDADDLNDIERAQVEQYRQSKPLL